MVTLILIPALVCVAAGAAEALHRRRCRRLGRLAFGPDGAARRWTALAPFVRVACLAALAWALLYLLQVKPNVLTDRKLPRTAYRHVILVLDVSPSMKIVDAGMERKQTRAQRASAVLTSLLDRIRVDQAMFNVVAVYTGAKPVITDTTDMAVIRNVLDDLPLDYAFDFGKTRLMDGIRLAAEQAKTYDEGSTTVIVVSDGDTVPDNGMPAMPPAVSKVLLLGLGSHQGEFLDGHQSRQDSAALRSVARRLGGEYYDVNVRFMPEQALRSLSEAVPLVQKRKVGPRELAMGITVAASGILALIPLLLTLFGSRWQATLKAGHER